MSPPSVLQVFVFRAGQYVGSEIFTEPQIVIGSGPGSGLLLDDPTVASDHAVLSHADGQATLLDRGAPGGSLINRTPIQHSYVTPRDEIQIGRHTLKIKFVSQPSQTPQEALPRPTPAPAQKSAPQGSEALQVIDDLISGELARGITGSIEINPADVVDTRSVSGLKEVDAAQTAPSLAPIPRHSTPADDLYGTAPAVGVEPTTQPTGQPILEDSSGDYEEDELDEDEIEASVRPGFSLLERLRHGVPTGPALEVTGYSGHDVAFSTLLQRKGERVILGRGPAPAPSGGYPGLRLCRLLDGGQAEIHFPSSATGHIRQNHQTIPLDQLKVRENAVSKQGDVFRTTISRDASVHLTLKDSGFDLRFVQPPPQPRTTATTPKAFFVAAFSGAVAKAIGLSFVAHLMVGAAVAVMAPDVSYSALPTEEWVELQPDPIREVEIEPEPEPEPEPVAEAPTEPEPEPPPKKERKRSKRTRAPAKGVAKKKVKSSGVLGAMGKFNLKAPGKKSMVQAVSNIDAVRAPGGSNFRVGALVGKTPSSKVSLGGGGGGKLLTRGSASLLKGGKGFARIGKSSGKVRGRVKRITSRRITAKGSISREEVARVINRHLKEVQFCYEKALIKDPGLRGKLVLEWTIKSSGSVGRVKQKTSTLKSARVASCIISSLKRWRFPKPRGGVVIVSYPFIFSSVGF